MLRIIELCKSSCSFIIAKKNKRSKNFIKMATVMRQSSNHIKYKYWNIHILHSDNESCFLLWLD